MPAVGQRVNHPNVVRVRERGVPAKSGTGDLLVTVEVAVPTSLTPDAREALEKFEATQSADPRPAITAALATGSRAGASRARG